MRRSVSLAPSCPGSPEHGARGYATFRARHHGILLHDRVTTDTGGSPNDGALPRSRHWAFASAFARVQAFPALVEALRGRQSSGMKIVMSQRTTSAEDAQGRPGSLANAELEPSKLSIRIPVDALSYRRKLVGANTFERRLSGQGPLHSPVQPPTRSPSTLQTPTLSAVRRYEARAPELDQAAHRLAQRRPPFSPCSPSAAKRALERTPGFSRSPGRRIKDTRLHSSSSLGQSFDLEASSCGQTHVAVALPAVSLSELQRTRSLERAMAKVGGAR